MGYYDDVLEHHGILGQKWGVRRFESASGHLTAAGKNRYNSIDGKYQKVKKVAAALTDPMRNAKGGPVKDNVERGNALRRKYGKKTTFENNQEYIKPVEDASRKANSSDTKTTEKKGLTDKQKKMIVAGAAVVGTALTAYGGYKLYQAMDKKATEGLSQKYKAESIKLTDKKYDAIDRMTKWQGNASNYANERNDSSHSSAVRDYAEKARQESLNMAGKAFKDYKDLSAKKGVIDTVAREKAFSKGEKVDFLKEKAAEKINSTVKRDVIKPNTKDWVADRIKDVRSTDNSKMPIYYTEGFSSGRKTPSKSVQNSTSVNRTINSGSKVTSNTIKIAGQTKFSQASKANNDLVNDLLKKNAQLLKGF